MSVPTDSSWQVAERWQQFDGERRANYLRLLAIGIFYGVHLIHHAGWLGPLQIKNEDPRVFHMAVTFLAAGWGFAAIAVNLALQQRRFPDFLPYLTTALDVVFLTSILSVGLGQQSPLVVGYLLIVILAALRIHLPLIQFATVVSCVGYVVLLGLTRWAADWPTLSYVSRERLPRYAQLATLLAIAISGIMLGQLVRRVRGMALGYAERRSAVEAAAESAVHRPSEGSNG